MVNERGPGQFNGVPRFTTQRPGFARPLGSSSSVTVAPSASRATHLGLGLGKGKGAAGLGSKTLKRHRKIPRDNIMGVTKGDIRRLARRGGVKRISANVYDEIRASLKTRLELILQKICAIVDSSGRKTVAVQDVIFTLNRLGNPIYGFDASFDGKRR